MTSFNSIFKSALLSAVIMLTAQTGKAQTISLTTSGVAYTQDFDALGNVGGSTTNTLAINGWTMTESGGGARDNELYAVDSGTSTTGDTYSYGQAGSTDRALGNLRSGTLISLVGAAFTNTTGATITSLDVSYVGEEWRLGTAGRTDQLTFEYSTDATGLTTGTWTIVTALNFITPVTTTTGGKDGNLAANRTLLSASIPSLSIPDGATFWIRWSDTDASGADDGLAVDDFSLTPQTSSVLAVPEMDIQWNAVSISDGSAFPIMFNGTYLGDQSVCSGTLTHTYTILNTGTGVLNLTGTPIVNLTGLDAASFTVTAQPSASIAAGGNSTFVISYDPSVGGSSSAIVEIANNDFDEDPYEFYIMAMGVEAQITGTSEIGLSCYGQTSAAISVTATGTGTLSYDWEPGAPTGDGTSGITGLAAGIYNVTVTDEGTCQAMTTFTVTEPAALTLTASASSTAICSGSTATLSAMANGGAGSVTYTWSTMENTASISVSPTVTSTYTIDITDANNCAQSNTVSVTVNDLPVISVNSGAICAGESFTITATGADTYTYSGGSDVVSPSADASYTVTGTSAEGCVDPVGVVSTVTVNSLPNVSATSNNTLLCVGETATLTASGADTYTWSTTETTVEIAVSPTVTVDYTVTGTDANGCVNSAVVTQDVSACTGIRMAEAAETISVYPNPSSGSYTVDLPVDAQVEIANQLGQLIYSKSLVQGKNLISINEYAEGVYFLKTTVDGKINITKVVKQ